MPLSAQRRFECIAPVPHTPEVPCVVGSRQSLLRRLPSYWIYHTTAGWTAYLVWMRRSQAHGFTLLQKNIVPPSGPGKYLQSTDRGSEGHNKCWRRSIMCHASFYLVSIVCTVQESIRTLVLYAFSNKHFSICKCTTHCWTESSSSQS